jgi:hypothetical protein
MLVWGVRVIFGLVWVLWVFGGLGMGGVWVLGCLLGGGCWFGWVLVRYFVKGVLLVRGHIFMCGWVCLLFLGGFGVLGGW